MRFLQSVAAKAQRRRIVGWSLLIIGIILMAIAAGSPSSTRADLTWVDWVLALVGFVMANAALPWALPGIDAWASRGMAYYRRAFLGAMLLVVGGLASLVVPP
jgi:hypothetical protein